MPTTLILPRRSIGSSCQTGNMAAQLNSVFLSLKFRFCLSIVSCIMIILCEVVQWDILCNWCVSLDTVMAGHFLNVSFKMLLSPRLW